MLDTSLRALEKQMRRSLIYAAGGGELDRDEVLSASRALIREFAGSLPGVRAALEKDIRAAYDGDPAATSRAEVLFCYPGITALTHHRIAHVLYGLDLSLLARIVSEIAHSATGIDIHPGARVGQSCFIDHGTGVVIGETTVIGDRVRIYQGVTLGARNVPLDAHGVALRGIARHPIIEDDVVIYAGATILGHVTIGRGSTIGGNVWLTHDVAPGSEVAQVQRR
jgi:serine O-acetyltransferase